MKQLIFHVAIKEKTKNVKQDQTNLTLLGYLTCILLPQPQIVVCFNVFISTLHFEHKLFLGLMVIISFHLNDIFSISNIILKSKSIYNNYK